MPQFEFEFNQQDKELVVNQEIATFSGTDYIRLTIYPTEAIDNIVTLANGEQAIFYSSLNEQPFEINISPFGAGLDEFKTLELGVGGADNDFRIYKNDNDIYIKPNEIFNQFQLPQGDYRIQIDFLNQLAPIEQWNPNAQSLYKFIVKQISTSRKEVRLKLLDINIASDDGFITDLTNQFNNNFLEESDGEFVENNPPFLQDGVTPNPNYKYQFKHVLNIGTGDHVPIMNYAFDAVTDGKDNQSLILKLYEPLSGDVQNLSLVTIEKEVITTQIQDIFYFSDVPDVFFGDGLSPQPQEDWIIPDGNDIQFENFDELSGSLNNITLDSLISQSQYDYPNINTDFNEFSNHTFFGLAEKKIINFKNKVEIIQGHYSEISNSLSVSSSIGGDSPFIIEKRKNLFKKIEEEFRNFTPYERFLYFDGQSESTSSAPGVGKNYANSIPLKSDVEDELTTLNNYEELKQTDGFNIVYKNSNLSSASLGTGLNIGFTNRQYKVHEKPFFNYSGSVYLSFLLKGTTNLELKRENVNNNIEGKDTNGFFLPYDTSYTASILQPDVTGSEYRRFIFEASQSYFVPKTLTNDMIELQITEGDFDDTSTKITVLSGSIKTGSSQMRDSTGLYPTTVVSHSVDGEGNIINGIPFFGSVMPAGDLFTISITSGSALTQSFVTDVKVTLNNPTDVLPFDNLFHTSSTEWTDWYNNAISQAQTFDTDNIHSFENNLPLYIQESSDYQDMKDFLNLQGEQYDLIRNHIDSLATLHDRGYKKTDSPPNNTLPMLLSNMGWQAINPFTGSLSDTLGSYLSGVTTIDDIKNNTWRKTLNNLLYIYKSKGTKNSVRGLLNTYGYPPDVLQFQEFGGSTDASSGLSGRFLTPDIDELDIPTPFPDKDPELNPDLIDLDLEVATGSYSFESKLKKLYSYRIDGTFTNVIDVDHYRHNTPTETIEFVYKHVKTTNDQLLLVKTSHAILDKSMFDLFLKPSADGISSSFEFRLNNSETGSLAIADNAVSMSTPYLNVNDGELWNVMLQRMTSSISGAGTQEYKLHVALQEDKAIKTYNMATMSVSGGISTDSNHRANQNWPGTGSFAPATDVVDNLCFGGRLIPDGATNPEITGSIAEVRGWSTVLSKSKFRQHILNKFSTVGNTINSHNQELIYHFRLNENYSTSSAEGGETTLKLVDSAPTTVYSDLSKDKPVAVFSGSFRYGFDFITTVEIGSQDNQVTPNDNNILINPPSDIVGNLNPYDSPIDDLTKPYGKKPQFKTSPKLELFRSPQNFVDNFILDKLGGFNFERLYGDPISYYSQSYQEFDTFRENFFDAYSITVDTNQFIRAHENMFNTSIIEGIKTLVPARSTFSDRNSGPGVEIRPTILEKQKYENEEHGVETNPNTATGSYSINVTLSDNLFGKEVLSVYDSVKEGSVVINTPITSSYEAPYTASIKVSDTGSIGNPYLGYAYTSLTSSVVNPHSASFSYSETKGQQNIPPTLNNSTYEASKDGTFNYGSVLNKSFENIHNTWGTSSADTQFINFAGGTGSYGTYNTYHIDTRVHFYSIGDTEYYSASMGSGSVGSSDFTNHKRFHNRIMLDNDFHSNVNYESLINGNPAKSIQTGRMIGKTRYFTTGSQMIGYKGTEPIILPSNHITKFSQPFKEQMYNGTQNTASGFLNVQHEDYSEEAFYRVIVTGGENQLIVKGSNTDIDSNDRIIY